MNPGFEPEADPRPQKAGVSGPDNDRTIFPTSLSRGVLFHCADISLSVVSVTFH